MQSFQTESWIGFMPLWKKLSFAKPSTLNIGIVRFDKRYDGVIRSNIRKNILIYLKGKNSLKSRIFALLAAISPTMAVTAANIRKEKNKEV